MLCKTQKLELGTSYQVTFTKSEFQALPLINNLIHRNSITDTRTYTSVEYFAIIRASLRERYKRGEEEQKGVRRILGRDTQKKGKNTVLEL